MTLGIAAFVAQGLPCVLGVSPSQLEVVVQYIETQQQHHRTRTCQEEYRELLRRHGVNFDERYVWD